MIPIEYVKWGIANRFDDHIELNENLKSFPDLHKAILNHELGHTNKTFSKKDLMLDISESKVSQFQLILFIAKNPRSLTQFLPIYWTKKHGFVYDINLCIIYVVIISLVCLGLYIGLRL